ncbi:coiled-coil domain-containing protein [Intestinibacter sp.]
MLGKEKFETLFNFILEIILHNLGIFYERFGEDYIEKFEIKYKNAFNKIIHEKIKDSEFRDLFNEYFQLNEDRYGIIDKNYDIKYDIEEACRNLCSKLDFETRGIIDSFEDETFGKLMKEKEEIKNELDKIKIKNKYVNNINNKVFESDNKLKEENKKLKSLNDKLSIEIDKKDIKLRDSLNQVNMLNIRYENIKNENEGLTKLQTIIDGIKYENKNYEEAIKVQQKEIEDKYREIEDKYNEIDKLKVEISMKDSIISSYDDEVKKQKNEINRLESEVYERKLVCEEVAILKKNNKGFKKSLETLEKENKELKQDRKELEQEVKDLIKKSKQVIISKMELDEIIGEYTRKNNNIVNQMRRISVNEKMPVEGVRYKQLFNIINLNSQEVRSYKQKNVKLEEVLENVNKLIELLTEVIKIQEKNNLDYSFKENLEEIKSIKSKLEGNE